MQISDTLSHAIFLAYSAIGFDIEPEDNEEAIELSIDADRLITFGGPEGEDAQTELRNLIVAHGYPSVLTALANEIQLM